MYQQTILANGLKIISESIPYVRSIAMGIWVKTGTKNEDQDLVGISHFLEHMMFKGTKKYSAKDIVEIFDSIGGQLNAFTSKEYTCYYAKFLDEHLSLAAETLSDMVLESIFVVEEIKKEQSVIIEEIKMTEDTPDDLVHELFAQAAWSPHPLSRPILGKKETVSSFNYETIVNYYKKYYLPSNIIITLAGNLDHEMAVDILSKKWSGLTGEFTEKELLPPILNKNIKVVNKDLEQVHICLGGRGVGYKDEDKFIVNLLNNIFGGSMSSRLFQSIREEQGLAYSVFSYLTMYKDAGLFTIYAGISKENFSKVISLIKEEVQKIIYSGVTEQELTKAKEQVKGGLLLGLESTSSRMSRLARSDLYYGRIVPISEIVEQIEKITIDDITRAAERYLNFDDFSCAVIGPIDSEKVYKIMKG
jgi:predicted Zn-dependent peptidase